MAAETKMPREEYLARLLARCDGWNRPPIYTPDTPTLYDIPLEIVGYHQVRRAPPTMPAWCHYEPMARELLRIMDAQPFPGLPGTPPSPDG